MSFFRQVIKNPKIAASRMLKGSVLIGAGGAYVGGVFGAAASSHEKVRFPKNINVMAKCSLFGAGKALQYAALPITYPVAKHLESKGRTDTFFQKTLFDFSTEAAEAEKDNAQREIERIKSGARRRTVT